MGTVLIIGGAGEKGGGGAGGQAVPPPPPPQPPLYRQNNFVFILTSAISVETSSNTVYSCFFKGSIFHKFALISKFKDAIFPFFFAMDSISVILWKYFNFTNLACITKFLKYKSLKNFQLYDRYREASLAGRPLEKNLWHCPHVHPPPMLPPPMLITVS